MKVNTAVLNCTCRRPRFWLAFATDRSCLPACLARATLRVGTGWRCKCTVRTMSARMYDPALETPSLAPASADLLRSNPAEAAVWAGVGSLPLPLPLLLLRPVNWQSDVPACRASCLVILPDPSCNDYTLRGELAYWVGGEQPDGQARPAEHGEVRPRSGRPGQTLPETPHPERALGRIYCSLLADLEISLQQLPTSSSENIFGRSIPHWQAARATRPRPPKVLPSIYPGCTDPRIGKSPPLFPQWLRSWSPLRIRKRRISASWTRPSRWCATSESLSNVPGWKKHLLTASPFRISISTSPFLAAGSRSHPSLRDPRRLRLRAQWRNHRPRPQ